MISEKMYETTINLEHPCKFVSSDSNALKYLEDTYVNKCYYGAYILEISEVNKVSMCRIITSNHRANGVVNVCFTAKVLNYRRGDIIPDVKIEIKNGQIMGVSKYAVVSIEKSVNTKILTDGQIIPVVVGDKVLYNVNSSHINVLSSILVANTKSPIYHISGTLDSKIYNTVSNLIDKIREQDDELKTKESKHFVSMLSLKSKARGGAAKLDKIVNIVDVLDKAKNNPIEFEAFFSKDLNSSVDSLTFNVSENRPSDDEFINTTLSIGIQEMIYQCYAIREGIINMSKFYDKEKMEQANNIWTLIKRSKLL